MSSLYWNCNGDSNVEAPGINVTIGGKQPGLLWLTTDNETVVGLYDIDDNATPVVDVDEVEVEVDVVTDVVVDVDVDVDEVEVEVDVVAVTDVDDNGEDWRNPVVILVCLTVVSENIWFQN